VAALLLAGLLVSCTDDGGDDDGESGSGSGSGETTEGVLRMGVVEPTSLDPAAVTPTLTGEMVAADLLFDGLTSFAASSGEIVPALAEWEASDDLRTWTFTLSDDAEFSDGTPVTADDVVASLTRLAAQGDESLRGVRLEVIDGYDAVAAGESDTFSGVTANDDGTVTITTSEPYAELPALLSDPAYGIVPADAVEDDSFADEPIGSGPFAIASRDDDGMVLEAVEGGGAALDAVELLFFDSVADSYAAFEDGELDWSMVPTEQADQAAAQYGDDQFVEYFAEIWLGMNLNVDLFDDERLRQAIIRGIDRPALLEEFYPTGIPLEGVVPQGVPGAQDSACADLCTFNPDAARTLLTELGTPPPTIHLDYDEEDFDAAAAEAIKSDLADVGITVGLRPHEHDEYRSFVTGGERELFLFGWVGVAATPDSYLAPNFLSSSNENVTGFGNSVVDAGIAAARGTEDAAERATAYQAAETATMQRFPIVPLVQLQLPVVVSERVADLVARPDGTFAAETVTVD
jgi:peptide/nickel transport system substrate-binding protein/oligopeptide transport system substrate-binding protein